MHKSHICQVPRGRWQIESLSQYVHQIGSKWHLAASFNIVQPIFRSLILMPSTVHEESSEGPFTSDIQKTYNLISESRGMTHHSQVQVYDGSWWFMALIGTIQFLKHRIPIQTAAPVGWPGFAAMEDEPSGFARHWNGPRTAKVRVMKSAKSRMPLRLKTWPFRLRWSAEPSWIFKMSKSKFRLAVFVREDDEQLWQNRWKASKNCLVLLIGIMFPKYLLQYLMENLERNLGKRWS